MKPREKHARLVELLNKRTLDRSLDWHVDRDGVWTKIAGRTISLIQGSNENGSPLEIVNIVNSDSNEIIESFNDEDLSDESLGDDFEGWWSYLENLRELAYRQATGADEVIDSIIDELDKGP